MRQLTLLGEAACILCRERRFLDCRTILCRLLAKAEANEVRNGLTASWCSVDIGSRLSSLQSEFWLFTTLGSHATRPSHCLPLGPDAWCVVCSQAARGLLMTTVHRVAGLGGLDSLLMFCLILGGMCQCGSFPQTYSGSTPFGALVGTEQIIIPVTLPSSHGDLTRMPLVP